MKHALLVAAALGCSACQAQTSLKPLILLSQPTAAEALRHERSFGSEIIPESPEIRLEIAPNVCPPAAGRTLTQPVRSKRPEGDFPFAQVEHYFSEADSTVWCSTYKWSDESPSVAELLARARRGEELEPLDVAESLGTYDAAFSAVATSVTDQLGSPVEMDPEPELSEGTDTYARTARWETDRAVVSLEMEVNESDRRLWSYVYWVP